MVLLIDIEVHAACCTLVEDGRHEKNDNNSNNNDNDNNNNNNNNEKTTAMLPPFFGEIVEEGTHSFLCQGSTSGLQRGVRSTAGSVNILPNHMETSPFGYTMTHACSVLRAENSICRGGRGG